MLQNSVVDIILGRNVLSAHDAFIDGAYSELHLSGYDIGDSQEENNCALRVVDGVAVFPGTSVLTALNLDSRSPFQHEHVVIEPNHKLLSENSVAVPFCLATIVKVNSLYR